MPKIISDEWILKNKKLLREKLPKEIQGKFFYPTSDFYEIYENDIEKGLDKISNDIFSHLGIQKNGCIIGFYSKEDFPTSSLDTAGFYTKLKNKDGGEDEVIMINILHRQNPLDVAAILVHEIMHLYLFRLGIKLEDQLENEQLTDLATIETGFGIVTLNGMNIHNDFILTIILAAFTFGKLIFWREGEGGYGYFKPSEYTSNFMDYCSELGITKIQLAGYLAPGARRLLKLRVYKKYPNSTTYTLLLREKLISKKIAQMKLLGLALIILYFIYSH